MTNKRRKFDRGIRLKETTDATTEQGEVRVDSADNKLKAHLDSSERSVVTEDQSQTITNKTIDVDNNTVSNIEVDNLKTGVLDTDLSTVSASDDTIPSAKATKAAIDSVGTDLSDHLVDAVDAHDASAISNVASGNLVATDVQGALNELQTDVDTRATSTDLSNHISDATDAHDASAVSNVPSGNLVATDVQAALNELQTELDSAASGTDLSNHISDTTTHGTTGDIVGTSDSQTLTNKTIDADNNTISNLAHGAEVDNPSSGVHGVTGSVVGTSDSQVITNKDIDGGTASNTSRLTVPKDTKANLDLLTRKEATVLFASDQDTMYVDNGSALVPVGSGAGTLDIFNQQTFEILGTSSFAGTGNNATYKNGGTLDGSLSDETTNPISGDQSPKYTAGSSSQNDWVEVESITLDDKQQSANAKVILYADSSNFSVDAPFVVWDNTNSQKLTTDLDIVEASTDKIRYEFSFFIPSNCASISYGFHFTNTPVNTETLVFDDVEFTVNPFIHKNLRDKQGIIYNTHAGFGSTNNKIPYYSNLVENSGSTIVTVENSSTNGFSITALKDCEVTMHHSFQTASGVGSDIGISLNSTQLTTNIGSITAADRVSKAGVSTIPSEAFTLQTSASVKLSAGDVLRPHGNGTAPAAANSSSMTILVTADTEHIITPAKSTLTDWTAYTPTYQGFGTPTGTDFYWRRVGSNMQIKGYFITGTPTAVEAQVNLPSGFTIDSTIGTSPSIVGTIAQSATTDGSYYMLGTSGDTFLNFSKQDAGAHALTIQNGNGIFGASRTVSFNASVPITGWDSNAPFLAAIPVQQVGFLKDVKAANTAGGTFTSGSFITRTLNTTEGDFTNFGSLSSNQFTLDIGTYEIEAIAPAHYVDVHKAKLRNITDSTDDIIGSSERCSQGSTGASTTSIIKGKITISSSKTFEIQHRCGSTEASDGLGRACNFGVDEVYTQVKITKLK